MIVVTYNDWSGTRRVAEEVAEITRLADFAERIRSDREKRVEGVLPVAERNRALRDAAERVLARVEGEIQGFDLDRFGAGSIDRGLARRYLAEASAGAGAMHAISPNATAKTRVLIGASRSAGYRRHHEPVPRGAQAKSVLAGGPLRPAPCWPGRAVRGLLE